MRIVEVVLRATTLVLLVTGTGLAQTGLDLMDVDIMFVGAHPDDDTGVLATFARYLLDEGFTGTVVTATGGDGGGNAIGPEAGRSLALIRKEEERRALALVGVDAPSFLGLTDFYFTLSAEETEEKWGASFVCDVVRHVRLQRPEVIVTMWPGPGTHGQHQMAARAATIAFDKASDPEFCPHLSNDEHLATFSPDKLYYTRREGPTLIEVPSDDFSRALAMRYADIRVLASAKYRSQGFDRFARLPVTETRPERFMLVRSRVPVATPETHLLAGSLVAAEDSPPGIRLLIEPASFEASVGIPLEVAVTFENRTAHAIADVELELEGTDGWNVRAASEGSAAGGVPAGETKTTVFLLTAGDDARVDENHPIGASYRATIDGRAVSGRNGSWVRARASVRARFRPLFDVAGYRDFARETKTEWVIETLPTRVPVVMGRTNTVEIEVTNERSARATGTLHFSDVPGISVPDGIPFAVEAGETTHVPVEWTVGPDVLPEGRQSARLPIEVRATTEDSTSVDTADIYALPFLTAERAPTPPRIDGDLSDMEAFSSGEITPEDLWWRQKPDGALDASGTFYLAYDEDFLYAGVRVRDDAVICNIAPDDVRAQLRSDAIGITIDPSGESHDTSTVIQAAAFPCTTDGFAARGFRDADQNQGPMEVTAPGMEVASQRTEDGYTFETRIPWSATPRVPGPGDEIGVNVILYDGDNQEARTGANISESGLGWAAFSWGGKQALPYLWPRVLLQP